MPPMEVVVMSLVSRLVQSVACNGSTLVLGTFAQIPCGFLSPQVIAAKARWAAWLASVWVIPIVAGCLWIFGINLSTLPAQSAEIVTQRYLYADHDGRSDNFAELAIVSLDRRKRYRARRRSHLRLRTPLEPPPG